MSLALYQAKARCVFVPDCFVHYVQPPQPVDDSDLGYFLTKWNMHQARRSHARIQNKWNLVRMPQLLGFVEERYLRGAGMLDVWQKELAALLSPGEAFILVDMQQWAYSPIVDGLQPVPFTENEGRYWGPPANDALAIQELERLRAAGIRLLVFAWHAFWWFDYYSGFYGYVCSKFPRIAANDHLVAFELGV